MADEPWWARHAGETASAWSCRILRDERTNRRIADVVREARRGEMAWLRDSMTADGIPEHIQRLVLAHW